MAFTACEWNEDLYKGAVAGSSLLVGYFNAVAEEFGREKAARTVDPEKTAGGFHKSLSNLIIRIDYCQHNISALLGYLAIQE